MKKLTKFGLSIGTIAGISLPIATVVSCSKVGLKREAKTIAPIDDDFIKTQFYKKGSTPTAFVPADNSKQFDFIVSKRFLVPGGSGITLTGLYSGVTNPSYQYGSFFDSIPFNFGYLQNGKLMLTAYYHENPITDTKDIRYSLKRIGDMLESTYDTMKSQGKISGLDLKSNKANDIKTALSNLTLSSFLESKPAELAKLDYLGIDPLADIFREDQFTKAKEGSDENKDKKLVMTFLSTWFTEFAYNFQLDAKVNHTVAENENLAYAWEETLGMGWDLRSGAIGDRRNFSPTLLKPWIHIPTSIDHKNYLGDYVADKGHEDIKIMIPTTGGKNPNSNKLMFYSGQRFEESGVLMSESSNELQAKGIYTYDKGAPRFNSKGKIISGSGTKRWLKFGLFSEIRISLDNNGTLSTETFDSDDEDINNQKSINGKKLKTILNSGKVKSFTFKIKPGAKWINSEGEKTKHNVVANDFWYSIQNSNYSTSGIRNSIAAAGGKQIYPDKGDTKSGARNSIAKKLEDSFLTNQNNKDNSYKAPSKQESARTPFYISNFKNTYGMESIKDDKVSKDNFMSKEDSDEFTITAKNSAGRYINLFWHDFIASPNLLNLKALPSEKIKSQIPKYKSILGQDFDQTKDKPILKYGIYYKNIANSLGDFEYAGRYYPYLNGEHSVVFKKNKYFGNNSGKVDSMTYEFIAQEGTWYKGYRQAYENNDIYKADFSRQELKDWKNEIFEKKTDKERLALGLTYKKVSSSTGDVQQRSFTLALPISVSSGKKSEYYFNDNFSKILYGDTIANIYKAKNIKNLAEALYHGTGLEFRSSIQTGINGFGIIHDWRQGFQQINSNFGPEALIPGSDSATNKLTVYNSKIFRRAAFGKNFVEVTDQEYRDNSLFNGNKAFSIQGTKRKQIEENIKEAIKNAGLSEKDNLISEQFIDYLVGVGSIQSATYFSHLQTAYHSLNHQVNFIANANPEELAAKA